MQEFHQLESARAYFLHFGGLLDRVEIIAHMVDAAAGGGHDIIEAGEIAHEQCLGIGGLSIEPAIGHRLSAAGLIAWVDDIVAEPLQ